MEIENNKIALNASFLIINAYIFTCFWSFYINI